MRPDSTLWVAVQQAAIGSKWQSAANGNRQQTAIRSKQQSAADGNPQQTANGDQRQRATNGNWRQTAIGNQHGMMMTGSTRYSTVVETGYTLVGTKIVAHTVVQRGPPAVSRLVPLLLSSCFFSCCFLMPAWLVRIQLRSAFLQPSLLDLHTSPPPTTVLAKDAQAILLY